MTEDYSSRTVADAARLAQNDAADDRDVPSASDLASTGIGGDWNLTLSDEDNAAAARSLWGDIVPQDEPPF